MDSDDAEVGGDIELRLDELNWVLVVAKGIGGVDVNVSNWIEVGLTFGLVVVEVYGASRGVCIYVVAEYIERILDVVECSLEVIWKLGKATIAGRHSFDCNCNLELFSIIDLKLKWYWRRCFRVLVCIVVLHLNGVLGYAVTLVCLTWISLSDWVNSVLTLELTWVLTRLDLWSDLDIDC